MRHRPSTSLVLCSLSLGLVTAAPFAYAAEKKVGVEPRLTRTVTPVPPVRDVPIDPKLQAEATEVLKSSLSSNERFVRAHAVEAARKIYGAQAVDTVKTALHDPDAVVRFAGTMAVGDAKITAAAPDVLKLVDDSDPNVRVGARYAMHKLGDTRFSHDLEKFAVDPDRGVRGNTALVLGRLGEQSAAKVLVVMLHDREPSVRLQAGEALWRMGDERGLKLLVAATVSAYPDDNIIGALALSGPKVPAVAGHIQALLTNEYPQVALAAARAMGQLGSDIGFGLALEGAKSKDPMLRYLAAVAFGDIGRKDAQDALVDLLHDKDFEDTRLAAALSLLQIGQK